MTTPVAPKATPMLNSTVLAGVEGSRPVLLGDAADKLRQALDGPDVLQAGQVLAGHLHWGSHGAEDEERHRLGVVQLVLDLTLPVEGVEGGDRGAGQQGTVEDGW